MVKTHNILLEAGTNELEIVEFYIDEVMPGTDEVYRGYYGVNVAKVLEIIRLPQVTALPEVSHPSVLGAFNQRSRIIPLVDLGMWLGKARAENEPPKVVVTEFNQVTTAFQVSGVNRIHRLSWSDVESPGSYVQNFSASSITGVVKMDERIIFILDLENVVSNLNPELGLKADVEEDMRTDFRYRAMVADDSAVVRNMLKSLLVKANFEVEIADNGKECWDRLNSIKAEAERDGRDISDYLQILISDIEMPSMDGHSLTRHVKNDPVLGQLPVVLFSSLISDKLRHKGEAVGADDQITKPEVGQLAARSKELIQQYFGVPAQ